MDSILIISILESSRKLTYRNIDCIVLYQMQHQYTNILSNNLTNWTRNIHSRIIKTDYLIYTETIIVSEKISSMLPSYSFSVIVSSSVFRYIEKTTPKINEYHQLHSEHIPSRNSPSDLCQIDETYCFCRYREIDETYCFRRYREIDETYCFRRYREIDVLLTAVSICVSKNLLSVIW